MTEIESSTDKRFSSFMIISFGIMVLIFALPLLRSGVYPGDDYAYHMSRIKNIADGLSAGSFPVKIHPSSLNGYGYGSGLFYPNFFLYLPAFLVYLGCSVEAAHELFLMLIVVSLICSSYFSCKYILKDQRSAYISTLLLVSSQTVLTNLFLRVAVGEAIAAVFVPLVVASLYNIVYDGFSKPWMLIVAFLGLVYSHTITLFLAILISAAFLIVNFKKVFSDPAFPPRHGIKVIAKIAACAVAVLAMSVGYWLPMLEQFAVAKFQVNEQWTCVGNNTLWFHELLSIFRPGIGLLLLLISVICLMKLTEKGSFSRSMIVMGLTLAALTTWIIPWWLLNNTLFNSIQFPWRLLTCSAVFLSVGVGDCFKGGIKIPRIKAPFMAITAIAIMLTLPTVVWTFFGVIPSVDDPANDDWAQGYGEWMPLGTQEELLDSADAVRCDNEDLIPLTRSGGDVSFLNDERSNENTDHFDVPLLYYKGYEAILHKSDGTERALNVVCGTNNTVRVMNPRECGEITVSYSGTDIQHISYIINILAVPIVLVILYFCSRSSKAHCSSVKDEKLPVFSNK